MYAATPAYPLSPTTPQASVASMIVAQHPALGRLPPQTVSGAVSYAELRNDARNSPPYVKIAPDAAMPLTAPSSAAVPTALPVQGGIYTFPSLFLAQLLGQDTSPQAQSIARSFETAMATSAQEASSIPARTGIAGDFLKALQETGFTAKQPAVSSHSAPAQAAQLAREPASLSPQAASFAFEPAKKPAASLARTTAAVVKAYLRYGARDTVSAQEQRQISGVA